MSADRKASRVIPIVEQGRASSTTGALEFRNPPPLAMVGLRQVDQLKVKREGPRQQNRALHGQRMHQFQRRRRQPRGLVRVAPGLRVAPPDGPLPQRLYVGKQLFAGLLAQHLAQQRAQ